MGPSPAAPRSSTPSGQFSTHHYTEIRPEASRFSAKSVAGCCTARHMREVCRQPPSIAFSYLITFIPVLRPVYVSHPRLPVHPSPGNMAPRPPHAIVSSQNALAHLQMCPTCGKQRLAALRMAGQQSKPENKGRWYQAVSICTCQTCPLADFFPMLVLGQPRRLDHHESLQPL